MNQDIIIVNCPHCSQMIIIHKKEIKCSIFRHGILKSNNKQIDPHAQKHICDEYVNKGLIWGCGRPFKLVSSNNKFITERCGYI